MLVRSLEKIPDKEPWRTTFLLGFCEEEGDLLVFSLTAERKETEE